MHLHRLISALTVIQQNTAGADGGGIDNAGGTLSITNAFVYSNTAENGGGIANGGNMTIAIVTLAGNSAVIGGGGIYNNGTGTVTDVTLGLRLRTFPAGRYRRQPRGRD